MTAPWRKKGNLSGLYPDGFRPSASPAALVPDRSSLAGYALAYAALGWRVLPLHSIQGGACTCGRPSCDSPGKHPQTTNGSKDATADAATISTWWSRWPDANIGVLCGAASGIWALDVDPRNGGDESLDQLEHELGKLPATVEALTGGGGRHLVFSYPAGSAIRQGAHKLGPGLDVKSDGGYIVVEPSNHMSGTAYTWEGSSDPLEGVTPVLAPAALVARMAPAQADPGTSVHTGAALSARKRAELADALPHLDADDRDNWIEVGMALHSTGAPEAFDLWDEWSQRSDKYRAGETAAKWAGFKPQGGITLDTVFRRAIDAGYRPRADLPSEFQGLNRAAADGEQESQTGIRLSTISEVLTRPRMVWTVDEVIPAVGVGVIYGVPGSGKTFSTTDLCMAIARGVPWFGRRVRQGGVVYVAAEGNLRDRLSVYLKQNNLSADDLGRFRIVECALNMLDPGTPGALSEAVEAAMHGDERIIIFDTLNRSMGGGKENDGEDMSRLLDAAAYLARKHNCVVIFIHHPGKDASKGARGHSSLLGAVDFELQVLRDGDYRQIQVTKERDAEDGYALGAFNLQYIQLGFKSEYDDSAAADETYGSCVVVPIEATNDISETPTKTTKPSKFPQTAFDQLKRALGDKERRKLLPDALKDQTETPPNPGQWVCRIEDWKHHIQLVGGLSNGEAESSERQAFGRAKNTLRDGGYIAICGDFVWLLNRDKA